MVGTELPLWSHGRMGTRESGVKCHPEQHVIFRECSVPRYAWHCRLTRGAWSPFAHHSVAVAIPCAGNHPLREASAAALAALYTAFSRCLRGVAVGVGSHLGHRRCRQLCRPAGGNWRRARLSLAGHRQLGTFGAGVEHFDESVVLPLYVTVRPQSSLIVIQSTAYWHQ